MFFFLIISSTNSCKKLNSSFVVCGKAPWDSHSTQCVCKVHFTLWVLEKKLYAICSGLEQFIPWKTLKLVVLRQTFIFTPSPKKYYAWQPCQAFTIFNNRIFFTILNSSSLNFKSLLISPNCKQYIERTWVR